MSTSLERRAKSPVREAFIGRAEVGSEVVNERAANLLHINPSRSKVESLIGRDYGGETLEEILPAVFDRYKMLTPYRAGKGLSDKEDGMITGGAVGIVLTPLGFLFGTEFGYIPSQETFLGTTITVTLAAGLIGGYLFEMLAKKDVAEETIERAEQVERMTIIHGSPTTYAKIVDASTPGNLRNRESLRLGLIGKTLDEPDFWNLTIAYDELETPEAQRLAQRAIGARAPSLVEYFPVQKEPDVHSRSDFGQELEEVYRRHHK